MTMARKPRICGSLGQHESFGTVGVCGLEHGHRGGHKDPHTGLEWLPKGRGMEVLTAPREPVAGHHRLEPQSHQIRGSGRAAPSPRGWSNVERGDREDEYPAFDPELARSARERNARRGRR